MITSSAEDLQLALWKSKERIILAAKCQAKLSHFTQYMRTTMERETYLARRPVCQYYFHYRSTLHDGKHHLRLITRSLVADQITVWSRCVEMRWDNLFVVIGTAAKLWLSKFVVDNRRVTILIGEVLYWFQELFRKALTTSVVLNGYHMIWHTWLFHYYQPPKNHAFFVTPGTTPSIKSHNSAQILSWSCFPLIPSISPLPVMIGETSRIKQSDKYLPWTFKPPS